VYHCNLCGPNRTFKQKGNLKIHITLIHGKGNSAAAETSTAGD
jgi:hypothetical protein